LLQALYLSPDHEHVRVRANLPAGMFGVYLNLDSPASKLNLFQGLGHTKEWWIRAYSDYLNCLLLKTAIQSFSSMLSVEEWRSAAGCDDRQRGDGPAWIPLLVSDLRRESSCYDAVVDEATLLRELDARIIGWSRFVNARDASQTAPLIPLPFGVPLFLFAGAINRSGIFKRAFRLFVLVDQYEALYGLRSVIDFRPMFNQALREASTRGGTGVEFKIGARPYSFRNLSLLEGEGRLEAKREMIEVDLDKLVERFYRRFALDLFTKRMAKIGIHATKGDSFSLAKGRLPGYTPREEAERYARPGVANAQPMKHLIPFENRWDSLGVPPEVAAAILEALRGPVHPLTGTLAAIAMTRWLRTGHSRALLRSGSDKPKGGNQTSVATQYCRDLVTMIDAHYSGDRDFSSPEEGRKITNFVRDAEQVALFVLASSYKNQRRYYCGIDDIIAVSSNVALVFIEILRACYELLLLDGGSAVEREVHQTIQSEAIYRTSENWYGRIPLECDYGDTLHKLLAGLGANFRRVQLELSAPDPAPNAFSVSASEAQVPAAIDDPRRDRRSLLLEAVSWGLLEQRFHQDKGRARGKRTKYELNKVYCPNFGLSILSKKDPMYVHDIASFLDAAIAGKEPLEIGDRLGRAKQSKKIVNAQPDLFRNRSK
jgi:hypothetical protein